MAKSKNATALFEVIHTAKRPPKASPSGGGVPTPKWWAKGSGKAADAARPEPESPDRPAAAAPEPSTGGTRRSWLSAVRRPESDADVAAQDEGVVPDADDSLDASREGDDEPKVVITKYYPPGTPEPAAATDDDGDDAYDEDVPPPSTPVAAEPAEPKLSWAQRRASVVAERAASVEPSSHSTFDPTANVAAADLRGERRVRRPSPPPAEVVEEPARRPRRSAGPTPSALKPAVDPALTVDRNAGEVRIRLSYGGAIAAAAILLVVLVIAYLIGQRSSGGVESIADQPTTSAQPAHPAVSTTASPPTAASSGLMVAAAGPAAAPAALGPSSSAAVLTHPVAAEGSPSAKRQVGMMYVAALYDSDRSTADRAAAFLNHNGIDCSVVPGPAGGALPNWYAVMGLRPFAADDHSAAEREYVNRIAQLGPKFDSRRFYWFEPQTYIWRADPDARQP